MLSKPLEIAELTSHTIKYRAKCCTGDLIWKIYSKNVPYKVSFMQIHLLKSASLNPFHLGIPSDQTFTYYGHINLALHAEFRNVF